MLERVTQSALYNAAEAGYEQAARADVARVDPLLRRSVNTRLRRAINAAIELTGPVDDVVDEQHQLRVAYLLHAGVLGDTDPRSTETVGEVFAKASKKAPKQAPRLWFFTPLVLLVLLGGGGLVGYQLFGPSPEQSLRRSALGEALGTHLPKWVVSLDRYRRARDGLRGVDGKLNKLKERRETLLASTKDALGDTGASTLSTLLDDAMKIEGSGRPKSDDPEEPPEPVDEEFVPEDEEKLFASAQAFNRVLADAEEPVLIDARTQMSSVHSGGDLGGYAKFREVLLLSYFVERHGTLTYAGEPHAVTLGKRLDNLNVTIAGDAYDSRALGGILVSLDLSEETLIDSLMTPLMGDVPWELVPKKEATMMEGGEQMIDRAGQVLRDELLGSAGVDQEVATTIGDLLAQRREFLDKMDQLKIVGLRTLLLDNQSIEKLEHFREENLEVFQVLELNEKLQGYEDAFKSILLLFADAATIRGVVFLLEKKGGDVPESLQQALTDLPESRRSSTYARRQMLSDLAAIAHSDEMSKTLLSLVVRRMLRAARPFAPAGARAAIAEIAGELGVEAKDPWISKGAVSKRFPAFYLALMEKPSKDVQKAAAEVFKRLTNGPTPSLSWK